MNYEELAFVNQQLAGMLKSGIPLEGALRQLCANMRRGPCRTELEALERDLARGVPLKDALASRKLPEFYVRMIQLGALLEGRSTSESEMQNALFAMWTAPVALLLITLAAAIALLVPAFRRFLRWWLPGFRESSLTNLASTINLMLCSGSPLGEALDLAGRLESGSPAGPELLRWKNRLAEGNAKITDIAKDSKVFPPLFVWLLAQGGEDLAAGFKKAMEIYSARASYRIELLLYVTLPVSMLVLGTVILGQFLPLFRVFIMMIDQLGDMGGPGS